MGAGSVATGHEQELALGDGSESILDGSGGSNTGGVSGRTAQDVVVVDEGGALSLKAGNHTGKTGLDEGLLLALGVDQDQIGVAHLGVVDGLAGTGGVNLHGVAILGFELGQQLAQQSGVIDGGGGGQADDLGLFGGGSNLAGVDGSVILDVEQVGAVLFNTVGAGHIQSFLGNQPLVQSVSTGGVHSHVGNGIAISVHEGSLGIDCDDGIGVQHVAVSFHQDAGVDHQTSLGGCVGFSGSGGFNGGSGGFDGCAGGLGGLLGAAGDQTQHHNQNQQQGNQLFHVSSSIFGNKNDEPVPMPRKRRNSLRIRLFGKRLVHRFAKI